MFKSDLFKNDFLTSNTEVKRLVRYFYDPTLKFDSDQVSAIWLLGQEYKHTSTADVITTKDNEDVVEVELSTDESHDPSEATASSTSDLPEHADTDKEQRQGIEDVHRIDNSSIPAVSNDPADGDWPLPFLDDFESRIWMTYRSNFPSIPRSSDPKATSNMTFAVRLRSLTEKEGFTSDTGWGCMIRSGQSLLANALLNITLPRSYRYRRSSPSPEESSILQRFADHPSAPFSIHAFVRHGAQACNTHPGSWFGPSATASCIAALTNSCPSTPLRVYVSSSNSEIYEDKFRQIACSLPDSVSIQPTLILLGIRLGIDRVTPVYHEALKRSLTYPQSIGIAGGRPSSSHYFVGVQGDTFFYLDPHQTQSSLPYHPNLNEYTSEELGTCHTRRLRGLKIDEMDPSMLMGFLIHGEADWDDFKLRCADVPGKKIVSIYEREPPVPGETVIREEAIDEVETFDDEDDEDGMTEKGEDELGHDHCDTVEGRGT